MSVEVKIKEDASLVSKVAGKVLNGLQSVTGKFTPFIEVPIVGDAFADVQDIVYMLSDYYEGNYRKLPTSTIIGSAAIIAYIASPVDLIPDKIPILGFIDDAFVIKFVVSMCIDGELKAYRNWRKENGIDYSTAQAETV